ncbi:MAG: endonuclease/exonuclease/phosphatase family protein [Deltaproteobacteria bacterium]|nr:endonuclease/exonuclease/phosphatase family protein [Deltaproteobacteria bacterium]
MRIRVATLNVWGLPEPFAQDAAARMQAIGSELASLAPDVIAFQEVFTLQAREQLRAAGARVGLDQCWHGTEALDGGGLLVLSRLPIEEARFERYSLRGDVEQIDTGEYISGKGFVRLRLATPDGPLDFITTHLHAGHSSRTRHAYRSHRTGQIIQLATRALDRDVPLVAVGDFNLRDEKPEYQVLTGLTGLRDVAAELGRPFPTAVGSNPYRGGNRNSAKRVDYVFVREGGRSAVEAVSVDRAFGRPIEIAGRRAAFSNHLGVVAEIDIRPEAGAASPSFNAGAVDLAARILAEGRAAAEQRRMERRLASGTGMLCAVAAAAVTREGPVSRRRLLRGAFKGASVVALSSSLGFSALSEHFVPDEIDAFDDAKRRLARLGESLSRRADNTLST